MQAQLCDYSIDEIRILSSFRRADSNFCRLLRTVATSERRPLARFRLLLIGRLKTPLSTALNAIFIHVRFVYRLSDFCRVPFASLID